MGKQDPIPEVMRQINIFPSPPPPKPWPVQATQQQCVCTAVGLRTPETLTAPGGCSPEGEGDTRRKKVTSAARLPPLGTRSDTLINKPHQPWGWKHGTRHSPCPCSPTGENTGQQRRYGPASYGGKMLRPAWACTGGFLGETGLTPESRIAFSE